MADVPDRGGAARDTASEGLSQLGARILNQLAISAWLPSAALVLLLAFVVQLGAVLSTGNPPSRWFAAATQALHNLGEMSAGSFFLLAAAVVVLTMLTQAFTFEAIRLLEGYWGIRRPARPVAHAMCRWHRLRRRLLQDRQEDLTERAWAVAENRIRSKEFGRFTEDMFVALRRMVLPDDGDPVDLPDPDQDIVDDYEWYPYAPPEVLRQLATVDKRLRDYPQPEDILPTRLGNVLRHFESGTGPGSLESIVEDRFDGLPFSLRVSHDEQRGRLDLYCSMTLVWLFVGVVAAVRFGLGHDQGDWRVGDDWRFGAALGGLCLLSAWFSYRAAVASARYYGDLLVRIAKYPVTMPGTAAGAKVSAQPATAPAATPTTVDG